MASTDDVQKLAALARLTISDTELEKFSKEFDGILSYIAQINELQIPEGVAGAAPALRNVFRADAQPHEPGTYTKTLTEQFPEREGNYLKVKKIISHD